MSAAIAMTMAASSCGATATTSEQAQETAADEIVTIDETPAAVVINVDTTGYTTTASGLKYKKVSGPATTGKHPQATSTVKVHYTGKHLNGETFDSSVDRGEPIDFPLNRVIPGWTEGVQLMGVGDKYQFIIPSALAYGPQGTPGGPIAPDEDLYFEVELLDVQ